MAAWLVLCALTALQAPPPPKPPEPATPDRLIRRLGTQRFSHGDLLTAVAISPDGTHLATGDGKNLKLWNLETGKLTSEIASASRSLAFSKDGALLASGSATVVGVIDVASGAQVSSLTGHLKAALSACFSPDATRLATGSDDVTVRVWDLKSGLELFRIEDHLNTVYAVAYSPDGTLLATGSRDGSVRIWSAADGKAVRTLAGHGDDVRALAFSADGSTLVSAGGDEHRTPGEEDRSIRTWDVASGSAKGAWPGHARAVAALALSPDGSTLASGSVDGEVRLWEFPAGKLRRSIRAGSAARSLSFTKDGSRLAVAGGAQVPVILDVATGGEVPGHEGHRGSAQSFQLIDGGARLVAGDMSGEILVWDLKTEKVVRRIAAHYGPVNRVAVSRDGKKLASVGRDKRVVIRNLEDGAEIARFSIDYEWSTVLAWWLDEDAVMVGAPRKGLELFDARTGKFLRSVPGLANVSDVAFSPDQSVFAIAERYSKVRIRNAATGEPRADFVSSMGLQSVLFHPSGRWVVGSHSGFVVHDLQEGRSSDVPQSGGPYRPVFSPDGRWIAGLMWGQGIKVMEFASGQPVVMIPMKPLRYTDCAFLPDRKLITGTEDTTLAIWNLESNIAEAAGKDLETLWKEMGEAGFRMAVDAFVARGDAAVGFLKERLAAKADEKGIARILGNIAGEDADARKKATAELVELGADGEAPLDRAIEGEKDEKRKEGLTKAREELLAPIVKSAATLRKLRAQEVLERIGSQGARDVVRSLAESAPSRRERWEAKLVCDRLK